MKLNKKQRESLFHKYGGKCAYCGCELSTRWHADHIEAVVRKWEFVPKGRYRVPKSTGELEKPELDCIENMNPSCPECNMYKGCMNIEQLRKELSYQVERVERDSKGFRFAKKFKQILITPQPIVFWFETFNKKSQE